MSISQSEKIRRAAQRGDSNSKIAKSLGIRYQTVWRTLHRPYQGVVPQADLETKGIRTKESPLLNEVDPNQTTLDLI